MIRTLGKDPVGPFWIDVTDPTNEELEKLATQFDLHKTAVKDCLDPLHLPKYEVVGETRFLILRHADLEACRSETADTVRELTRKLALFVLPNGLITIHRSPQPFIDTLYEDWKQKGLTDRAYLSHLLNQLTKAVYLSYEPAMGCAEESFASYEAQVLQNGRQNHLLERLYFLKRKVIVYKKMLRASIDAVARIEFNDFKTTPYFQDLREEGERQYFHADELVEDVISLLQTQLAIASHKTNEVMRILTLFSVFFLPLTFIVGIYGMNFKVMPELEWHYGYPAVMGLMVVTTIAIGIWFRKKGWL